MKRVAELYIFEFLVNILKIFTLYLKKNLFHNLWNFVDINLIQLCLYRVIILFVFFRIVCEILVMLRVVEFALIHICIHF